MENELDGEHHLHDYRVKHPPKLHLEQNKQPNNDNKGGLVNKLVQKNKILTKPSVRRKRRMGTFTNFEKFDMDLDELDSPTKPKKSRPGKKISPPSTNPTREREALRRNAEQRHLEKEGYEFDAKEHNAKLFEVKIYRLSIF